ncbi:MAG: tetratricopeptide repeat protein [Syntrophobacter sp.]
MCAMSIIGKLNRSGMEACRNGFFKEAECHLLAALDQARLSGSQCTQAKIRNNLGILYELQGLRDRARHHYGSALDLMKSKLSVEHPLYTRLTESLSRVMAVDSGGSARIRPW